MKGLKDNNTSDKANEMQFILCSKTAILYALATVDILHKYNQSNQNLFKSYTALQCRKEDLIKSFYFLNDVILFCKEESIYKNREFASNLNFLYSQVSTYFLDVPKESIPMDQRENYAFGRKFKLLENLGPKQLQDLTLVDWRSHEQWQYWAEQYGENDLGEYCKKMMRKV